MLLPLLLSLLATLALADQLLQVHFLFRHGARYQLFPNFLYSQFASQLGELSANGMRQHYLVGRWLRQRYVLDQPFLSYTYNSSQIHVQSTDKNRYRYSLSHSTGLSPPRSPSCTASTPALPSPSTSWPSRRTSTSPPS